jgi:hypothetical protein
VSFPTGPDPEYVALADLTGNGLLDIITANRQGDSVSVLMNLGGSFGPPVAYNFAPPTNYGPFIGAPTGLAVGDFTGNGKIDIAVSDTSGDVAVLAGHGDGTFSFDAYYAAGYGPQGVVAGPFFGPGLTGLATGVTTGNLVVLHKANRSPSSTT